MQLPKVNRGDYCTAYQGCRQKDWFKSNPGVCQTCTSFDPIFKGVDPGALKKMMFKKKEKDMEKDMKQKTCTKCLQPFPATKEYFYAAKKTKDGLHAWCKKCHNKSCSKTPVGKTTKKSAVKKSIKIKPPAGSRTQKKDPDKKSGSRVVDNKKFMAGMEAIRSGNVLSIDFTGHEKLLNELTAYAEKKFRTPQNQLLYWLSNIEQHENIII